MKEKTLLACICGFLSLVFIAGMVLIAYDSQQAQADGAVIDASAAVNVEPATATAPVPPADVLPVVVNPIDTGCPGGNCTNGRCGIDVQRTRTVNRVATAHYEQAASSEERLNGPRRPLLKAVAKTPRLIFRHRR